MNTGEDLLDNFFSAAYFSDNGAKPPKSEKIKTKHSKKKTKSQKITKRQLRPSTAQPFEIDAVTNDQNEAWNTMNSSKIAPYSSSKVRFQIGDEAEKLIMSCPQWLALRENFLSQLHALVNRMSCEFDLRYERQLVPILRSYRKITIRIVENFTNIQSFTQPQLSNQGSKEISNLNAYVCRMATSLDWMNEYSGLVQWMNRDPLLNPLLSIRLLDCLPLNSQELKTKFASPIELANQEEVQCQELENIVLIAHRENLDKNVLSKSQVVDNPIQSVSLPVEVNGNHRNNSVISLATGNMSVPMLSSTLRRKNSENSNSVSQPDMETSNAPIILHAQIINCTTNDAPAPTGLMSWFKIWKHKSQVSAGFKYIMRTRALAVKRKIYDVLLRNMWQCSRYRDMQETYLRKLIQVTWRSWHQYTLWCRKLNIVHRSNRHRTLRIFLSGWKSFVMLHFEVRRYRHNTSMRTKITTLACFRNNVVLKKYELKKRLQTCMPWSFHEQYLRNVCFERWSRGVKYILSLDALGEKIDLFAMKDALVRWALSTWPKIPKKSAQEKLHDMSVVLAAGSRQLAAASETRARQLGGYLHKQSLIAGHSGLVMLARAMKQSDHSTSPSPTSSASASASRISTFGNSITLISSLIPQSVRSIFQHTAMISSTKTVESASVASNSAFDVTGVKQTSDIEKTRKARLQKALEYAQSAADKHSSSIS